MKLTLEQAACETPEVLIRGDLGSPELQAILAALQGLGGAVGKLFLFREEQEYPTEPADIGYFEARDNKVYARVNGAEYEAKYKLYELEALLKSRRFVKISKAVVVNVDAILSVSAEFSGNLSALMKDGKTKLTISRKYVEAFRKFVMEG